MNVTKHTGLFALLFSLLFLPSCVSEDFTGCVWEQPLKIKFEYAYEGIGFAEDDDLRCAHLYLFDSRGAFVRSWVIPEPEMGREYEIAMEGDPGRYDFMVWFNQSEGGAYYTNPAFDAFKIGQTLRTDPVLGLNLATDHCVRSKIPHLLFGELNSVYLDADDEVKNVTIPVRQKSNTINLTVIGLPGTPDTYAFTIADDNGTYRYDGSYGSCQPFTYTTTCRFNESRAAGNLKASLMTLKLGPDRGPRVSFVNQTTGEELFPGTSAYSGNLIELINRYYKSVDYNRRHLFDIVLTYDTDMKMTVDVTVWGEVKNDYEIF